VCVYLRMYVRAYLATPCVSAKNNVQHIKSNIRCVSQENKSNQINVKYIRIHAYEYKGQMFATNLPHRDRKPKEIREF